MKPVLTIVPTVARVVFVVPVAVIAAGTVPAAEVCPFPLNVIVEFHRAYKVVSPAGANVVAPTAYDVPLPLSAVFHPPNVKLVRARVPELDASVKVSPAIATVLAFGTEPLVALFASYVTTLTKPVEAAAAPQFPPEFVLPFVNSAM